MMKHEARWLALTSIALAVFTVLVVALAGCGGKGTPQGQLFDRPATHPAISAATTNESPPAAPACPSAANGQGQMGGCAPPRVGLGAPKTVGGITYPDLSNNDPVSASQMARIKAHGHKLVYLKVNQGTSFTDKTFAPMVRSAHALGMSVGGYDFVSCYCAAEANRFVALLRAAGERSGSSKWAPPTLDVEYGSATRSGILTMASIIRKAFGRVNVYTGNWFWSPHLGCWWPGSTVTAWLAGYPFAPTLCGLTPKLYNQHQFTDRGYNGATNVDLSSWTGTTAAFASFARLTAPKPSFKPTHSETTWCRRLTYYRKLVKNHDPRGKKYTWTKKAIHRRYLLKKHNTQCIAGVVHKL